MTFCLSTGHSRNRDVIVFWDYFIYLNIKVASKRYFCKGSCLMYKYSKTWVLLLTSYSDVSCRTALCTEIVPKYISKLYLSKATISKEKKKHLLRARLKAYHTCSFFQEEVIP